MYDILIKNGNIIDGTGRPMFQSDVAIKGDRIVKIGELEDERGEVEIDARDKFVCPGFIDVNNHSDTYWQMFLNPDMESLVYQGITTMVGGVCGSSLAPLATPKTIESIQKWTDLGQVNVDWLNLREFFDFLSGKKFSLNFATLVGHATLRRGVLKDELRSPNPKELKFIEKMLTDSMKEGALGLSTGLVYTHARMAKNEELSSLAEIVKKYDGVYATHIKDESEGLVESVEEAVRIAKVTKVKLHISHLKAMGQKNWKKMDEVLEILTQASKSGAEVSFDVYPYISTGSVLYTMLPAWVAEGGKKIMLHRLKDPAIRAKVISEMKDSDFEYDKVEISSSPFNKTLSRRKITEIAESQGKTVEDAVVDILVASEGRVIASMEVLSEENVEKAVLHPLSIIATNGAGYSVSHRKTGEDVHPRSFGAFTKILAEYVFRKKLLSFEEAIRKMTSFPAEKFNLKKRGKIEGGYFADLLILDKDKIASPSSKENPYQYSRGVEYSFVNGKTAIKEGKYAGEKNGVVIRR